MELYIHIPFCVKKCDYCDFLSLVNMGGKVSLYMNALRKDLKESALAYAASCGLNGKPVLDTIYIGGGTPSYIPAEEIAATMDFLRDFYDIKEDAEITIEANPCTVTKEKMETYLKAGINRVSMGVQSFNDETLKKLGRVHDVATALKAVTAIREAGFKNLNLDLISCVPGESKESFFKSLNQAICLNPEHISAYELIIEEGTPFFKKYGPDSGYKFDEDIEADIYLDTSKILKTAGYTHYEISNFAKPGFESRHNLGYWNQTEYIGCGLGAVSGFEISEDGKRTGWFRTRKSTNLEDYISDCTQVTTEEMDTDEAMVEYALTALRTTKGLNLKEFEKLYKTSVPAGITNVLDRYVGSFVNRTAYAYSFTEEGFLISNSILSEIL